MERLFLLGSLLALGCGSGGASAGREPVTEPAASSCTPTYEITATPGTRYEDVATEATIAWPVPGVTFAATVTRVGEVARIEGVLTNGTDAEVSVDYLTGGLMGVSTNPFQIDIDTDPPLTAGPEVYPTPRRAVMPPRGTITYRADHCPRFPANVRWTFSPWQGPPVMGTATLP